MCDECKRLKEEVSTAESEAEAAAAAFKTAEFCEAETAIWLAERQAELRAHRDSCAAPDDWEYHQNAEAAGQTSILDSEHGE